MSRIFKLITKLFEKKIIKPIPLGRWNIEYCSKKINDKVDLSNEDHCGPCGEYNIIKTVSKNIKTDSKIV